MNERSSPHLNRMIDGDTKCTEKMSSGDKVILLPPPPPLSHDENPQINLMSVSMDNNFQR